MLGNHKLKDIVCVSKPDRQTNHLDQGKLDSVCIIETGNDLLCTETCFISKKKRVKVLIGDYGGNGD